MKKLSLILCGLILIFNSCKKEKENDFIIFSGEIKNSVSDSLNIVNRFDYNIHTLYLSKQNTFNDTITIPEGLYYITSSNGSSPVYLKPGYNLKLTLNEKKFLKSLKYTGIGAYENNYLTKKNFLNFRLHRINNSEYQSELNEKEYLILIDSLYNVKMKLFYKHKQNFGTDFTFIEYSSLKYEKLDKIYSFDRMKRFVTGDNNFKVSANYPNPFDSLDLTNGKLSKAQYYIYFLPNYLRKKTNENWNEKDSIDYEVALLKSIEIYIENAEIKEAIAHHIGIQSLDYTNELDEVFNIINSYISNDTYLDEVKKKYESLKTLSKGSISPLFELYDIKNNLVSLNELKGKIVYIDIWATWCAPCVKEIPHLNKLEKEFRDSEILFVSICKNDKKELWRKMVNEKELRGIQLFAADNENSFFREYVVQAIPRFILIDKDGKVIDVNAKRPSDPALREQLKILTE